jgi:hypothetical protein
MNLELWEVAWSEYVEALDAYEADWSGEDFPFSMLRVGHRLSEAKSRLRGLDPEFCNRLEIV